MTEEPSTRRTVAVIPARGGSKGIPGKNLATVGGLPLVARAVRAALAARGVHEAYVSTDDERIAEVADRAGARAIMRPADLAADDSTSESALLHALDVIDGRGEPVETLVFIQPTSPFVLASDLDAAIEAVNASRADVAFSAFPTHAFLWGADAEGLATAINHDPTRRPRRQDLPAQFQESGAFYVLDAAGFRAARFRFFGRVHVQPVDPAWALEIDALADLDRARWLAPYFERASRPRVPVDAVVTDFDGVHTDDSVVVHDDGSESVRVSRSDGMGVALLRERGIKVAVLSKERNPVVTARARKLGVEVLQGVDDKAEAIARWARSNDVELSRVAYLGNDVNDIPALELVGFPVVVADAHPETLAYASLVLTRAGGDGAVRELADLVLDALVANEGYPKP